jgi:hypothetical protein
MSSFSELLGHALITFFVFSLTFYYDRSCWTSPLKEVLEGVPLKERAPSKYFPLACYTQGTQGSSSTLLQRKLNSQLFYLQPPFWEVFVFSYPPPPQASIPHHRERLTETDKRFSSVHSRVKLTPWPRKYGYKTFLPSRVSTERRPFCWHKNLKIN